MKSGEKIQAMVQEITLETVRYKTPEFPDGPMRVLPISELTVIEYANGTVHVFEQNNQNSALDVELPENKKPSRLYSISLNAGPALFVNNVYNQRLSPGPGGQLTYSLEVARSMAIFIKAYYVQTSSAYETRTATTGYNALAEIKSISPSAGFEYNWYPKTKSDKPDWKLLNPYISVGVGASVSITSYYFDLQTTVKDANGYDVTYNYHYWDDGLIRNVSQSSPVMDDLRVIERDFKYETRLREFPLNVYALTVPFEFGLRFRITNHFGLNIAYSSSMDILFNSVSIATGRLDTRFNYIMLPSVGLTFFMGGN